MLDKKSVGRPETKETFSYARNHFKRKHIEKQRSNIAFCGSSISKLMHVSSAAGKGNLIASDEIINQAVISRRHFEKSEMSTNTSQLFSLTASGL